MKMEMSDLERIIDERSKNQAEQVTKDLQKNLGATVSQAQIDEAVKKAVAEINAKAEKDKNENIAYLEAFKEAVKGGNDEFVKETPVTIVNQMIASAVSAMRNAPRSHAVAVINCHV
jgi:hypothetical protein